MAAQLVDHDRHLGLDQRIGTILRCLDPGIYQFSIKIVEFLQGDFRRMPHYPKRLAQRDRRRHRHQCPGAGVAAY